MPLEAGFESLILDLDWRRPSANTVVTFGQSVKQDSAGERVQPIRVQLTLPRVPSLSDSLSLLLSVSGSLDLRPGSSKVCFETRASKLTWEKEQHFYPILFIDF